MPHRKVAFRCKHCGFLEHSANAGESSHAHACRVCGKGVQFAAGIEEIKKLLPEVMAKLKPEEIAARTITLPYGIKFLVPENWEVLADCSPDRLAELGLEADHCEKHTPCAKGETREPRHIHVTAQDGLGAKDRT